MRYLHRHVGSRTWAYAPGHGLWRNWEPAASTATCPTRSRGRRARLSELHTRLQQAVHRIFSAGVQRLCDRAAAYRFGSLVPGRKWRGRARKLSGHQQNPLDPAEHQMHSVEAPMIALAMIREFGDWASSCALRHAEDARRAGDIFAAAQWHRIADIIRNEQSMSADMPDRAETLPVPHADHDARRKSSAR